LAWIDQEEIQITKPDVLKYLEYLNNKRHLQNISRARVLNCLNHYFTFLITKQAVDTNPCAFLKIRGTKKQNLYRIYSLEQLSELYDSYYHTFVREYNDNHIPKNQRKLSALSKQRNAVMLSLLINQGTTTKEIDTILLDDIDLMGATIRLHGARKGKDRVLPLAATQIGVLMHYLQNIRPQLLNFQLQESQWLFLTLPSSLNGKSDNDSIMNSFKPLTTQLKSIDQHFLNFKQVRASVITHWITAHGLRKAQYMAGHRQISTTEKYLSNDLTGLTNDINKLHPLQ
jgi:site-specific recombinase XerD